MGVQGRTARQFIDFYCKQIWQLVNNSSSDNAYNLKRCVYLRSSKILYPRLACIFLYYYQSLKNPVASGFGCPFSISLVLSLIVQ